MAKVINPFEEEIFPPFTGMPKDALVFLRGLKRNNNRPWFEKNKERYNASVVEPFRSLLQDLGEKLRTIDPDILVDPKKDVYRIYRDVRFSKDKTPYKTWIAASWTFRGGSRKTDPGFYVHIGAEEIFVGGGMWDQIPDKQKRLRKAIAADPAELTGIVEARAFRKRFGAIEGERLKLVPKGFDKEHPAAELLKMKQWLCGIEARPEASLEKQFVRLAADTYRAMIPFVRYLFEHS